MFDPTDTINVFVDMGTSAEEIREVSRAVDQLGESAKKAEQPLEKLGKKSEEAAQSALKPGRAMLESGRIIQDFAQGGVAGIINNIEGLTLALGGPAGLAGMMTAVGVAAYLALPLLKNIFQEMTGGTNDVPQSANRVEMLTDKIKDNAKALAELEKQGKLSNVQLQQFNVLTNNQLILEKQRDDAQKARAAVKAAEERRPAEQAERGAALAEYFVAEEATKLKREVLSMVTKMSEESTAAGSLGQLQAAIRAEMHFPTEGGQFRIARLREQLKATRGFMDSQADQLINSMFQGIPGSVEGVMKFLPPASKFRGVLATQTTAALDAQRKEDEADEAEGERRRQARERRVAANREAEKLTTQGRTNQEMGERDAEHQREQDVRDQAKSDRDARERVKRTIEREEGERAARALRAETGQRVEPDEARRIMESRRQQARTAAERDRADIREAGGLGAVQEVQQAQMADFGVFRSLAQTARMMKDMQQERAKALDEMVEAMVATSTGMGREVMMMRSRTRFLEGQGQQLQQPAWSNGHP